MSDDVAAALIYLRIKNPAAVGRNGQPPYPRRKSAARRPQPALFRRPRSRRTRAPDAPAFRRWRNRCLRQSLPTNARTRPRDGRLLKSRHRLTPRFARSGSVTALGVVEILAVRRLESLEASVSGNLNRRSAARWRLPNLQAAAAAGAEIRSSARHVTSSDTYLRLALSSAGVAFPHSSLRRRYLDSRPPSNRKRSPVHQATSAACR